MLVHMKVLMVPAILQLRKPSKLWRGCLENGISVAAPDLKEQSMKFPIAWHKNCLENSKKTLAANTERVQSEIRRLGQDRTEIEFYERQIYRAMKDGKDGFDR
jgi:hypothetical protein